MSRWTIEKSGTGIEKSGTGIEKSGTGIEKSGTGIEKSGTGIEKSGTGIRRGLLACLLVAASNSTSALSFNIALARLDGSIAQVLYTLYPLIVLGLLALIAVGGLIPFWMWVYFVYNPPIR